MRLFDSHAHIDDKCYAPDFEEMLERARENEVQRIMVVGINLETTQKAIRLAAQYPNLYASVGLHPHDASSATPTLLDSFKTLANTHDSIRAWGETGLDFNRMFSPQDIQETVFEQQLECADELDLPLIFHERDSKGRFYEILTAYEPKIRRGVVHCFSGTKEEMFKYLDLGYHIGITGILTIQQRGAYLREIAPLIPGDRLLIETDAPYLTPKPQRNKFRRNEPAFVRSVMLTLAQVRDTDIHTLSEQIWHNTCDLYGIDPG